MNLDFRPLIAIWVVFALAVLVMFIRRKMVAAKEDDNIHVMSGPNPEQALIATKLEVIDKWGKILTVITLIFGLALAALYIYSVFVGRPSVE
ncbi:MAG: hypothetical protein JST11_01440 [Acidobacteria bacterium]|nr:hypothetical protein [Acidobacteriota bacterium]